MRRSRLLVALAVASLMPSAASADLIISTWMPGGDDAWTESSNWTHSQPGLDTFPHNGNEGHTYDAQLNGSALLGQDITLDRLTMLFGSGISGNTTLQVIDVASFEGPTAGFHGGGGGVLNAPHVTARNALVVHDWTVVTDLLELGAEFVNGAISLDGAAMVSVNGQMEFFRDGQVSAANDGPLLELNDATFIKSNGTGTADIKARTIITGGAVVVEQGQIRFPAAIAGATWPVQLDSVELQVPGTEMTFGRGSTMSGSIGGRGNGTIRFENGVHTRNEDLFGAEGVTFEMRGDAMTGGALRVDDGLFRLLGGSLSNTQNFNRFEWASGSVGSFTNRATVEGDARTAAGTTGRLVNDTFTNEGHFTQGHDVELFDGATLCNTNLGTWLLANSGDLIDDPDEDPGAFHNVGGVVRKTGSGLESRVDVEFTSTGGSINLDGSTSLAFRNATTINATSFHLGQSAELDFEGDNELSGIILVTMGPGASIELVGGTTTNLDTVADGADDSGEMGVSGGAVLSGGIVELGSPANGNGLILAGGRIENLINGGHLAWQVGVLSGVSNLGTLTSPGLGLRTVDPPGLVSAGVVDQKRPIRVALGATITNDGLWVASDEGDLLDDDTPPVAVQFMNAGTYVKQGASTADIRVLFDNAAGEVSVEQGRLKFHENTCVQYDPDVGALTGGTWNVSGDGVLEFNGGDNLLVVGADSIVTKAGAAMVVGLGAVRQNFGTILVDAGELVLIEDLVELDGELGDGESIQANGGTSTIAAQQLDVSGTLSVSSAMTVNTSIGITLDGGLLRGGGLVITPIVDAIGGTISPGFDMPAGFETAQLDVDGMVAMSAGASLAIEIGDAGHDALAVTGDVDLNGAALVVSLLDGHEPAPSATYDVLVANAVNGTFNDITAPAGFQVEHLADRVRLTAPACAGDLDGDALVGFSDLVAILSSWGTPAADLDGDGNTGLSDLLVVLAAWGPCGS